MGSYTKIWNLLPDLFATLKTLTLKQVWLLEGIYEQAIKNKKADLSHLEKPEIFENIEQYVLLPDLIKELVQEFVRFE